MRKDIRQNPFYWASRLILDYKDTLENPEFKALEQELKQKALFIFKEQKLIKQN